MHRFGFENMKKQGLVSWTCEPLKQGYTKNSVLNILFVSKGG